MQFMFANVGIDPKHIDYDEMLDFSLTSKKSNTSLSVVVLVENPTVVIFCF